MEDSMAISNTPDPEAYLIPFPAESFSKPVPITLGKTFIGREPSNTIQIAHDSVAQHHALIKFSDGQYLLEGLDTQAETCVNSIKIKTAPLKHHDKLSFGNRTFLFLMKSRPPQKEPAKSLFSTGATVTLFEEEVEPSELLAQTAKEAARGMFRPTDHDLDEEIEESSLAHHRLSLLYQLSEQLRSTKVLDQILDKGLELILSAFKAAERAMILLGDQLNGDLEISAIKYRNPQTASGSFPISRTIVDWVLTEKIALVSQNLTQDLRFQDSDSIRIHNLNAIIVVPLMKDDKVIGMLYIDGHDILHPFGRQDVAFAAAVANELALCIENVRLQNELIQSERMAAIGLTMSNLAHNIKNLLALNQNSVDLLGMQLKALEDIKIDKSWRYILQSFTRINNLAINMLAFAKEQEMDLKPVPINKIILANREVIESSLGSKGIELELILSDANPRWIMDAHQFHRVLLNLVVNAIDAVKHKSGGKITIATALDELRDLLSVSVSDNGIGIAQDRINRIFELFYTTKGTGGTGLGLPMVQKFVEKMGGTISVQSGVDVGSTFTMTFPKGTPSNSGNKALN
jgi:signal transduction histidine kinase